MVQKILTPPVKEFFKTWWPGVILATLAVGIPLFQAVSSFFEEQKQKELLIMERSYEAAELLGWKPTSPGTLGWSLSRGKFEVTEEDRERLEKVRRIIQEIEIISGQTEELDLLKMHYLLQYGDFEQLEKIVFEKAGSNKESEALSMLAMMYLNIEGLEQKGLSYMEEALKNEPKNIWLRLSYGMMLHSHRRNEESITILNGILAEEPFHDDAVQFLSHVYSESENMDKAKSLLNAYHDSGRETFNSHYTLGNLFLYEKNHQAAIDEYQKGLTLYQESVLIHNALRIAYSDLGQTESAEKHKKLSELYSNISHGEDKRTRYEFDSKSKIKRFFSQFFTGESNH
jgi:tetratricopeptide (TPR) repeat protein